MAAHSILDHFNATSCYHFVNNILKSNLSCFWGLSLSLSLHINQLLCKDFFFKTIRQHIPISFMVSTEHKLLFTQIAKFEKLYCLPPPIALFRSFSIHTYEKTSSGKGFYRQCRLPIQIMFKFFKEYTCINVLIWETFSRGVDDPLSSQRVY